MEIINGDGVVLYFRKDGAYLPFGCARSITVNLTSEIIGKSTIGSGIWKEKEMVSLDWNFTMEGIGYFDTGITEVPDMLNYWRSMGPIRIEFFIVGVSGSEILMTGNALITTVTANGAVNNISSFNMTGEGTGELTSSVYLVISSVVVHADPVNEVDITFDFDDVGASIYTIEVTDITDSTTTPDAGGAAPRTIIGLDSTHSYKFRLKNNLTEYYSPYIYYSL